MQMTAEYVSRCASPEPRRDLADALPALEAVLSA
jgi:hypothetical protein